MKTPRKPKTPKKAPKSQATPYVIDTLKAAAAVLGVPIKLLKEAKDSGCPAFRGGRVYVEEWKAWVKDNEIDLEAEAANAVDPVTKEEWEIERLRRACRKLDVEYEKAKAELIPKQDVIDTCQAAFMPICSAMERYLDRATYNAMCREVQTALDKICK